MTRVLGEIKIKLRQAVTNSLSAVTLGWQREEWIKRQHKLLEFSSLVLLSEHERADKAIAR